MRLTDWHRLFGMSLTDYFTDTFYTVELEKDLSLKKQMLDVAVIRKTEGNPPAELADGLDNLAAHNLVSYKSMREPLNDWALDELTGHFVNYRKQVSPSMKKLLPKEDFSLYAVCTRYPGQLANKAGTGFKEIKKGVYEIRWGLRGIRIIVTSRISKNKANALWLMFSAEQDKIEYGISNYTGRLDEMSSTINQLLVKYQTGGIIAMTYTIEDYRKELKENVLRSLTPDEVLQRFSATERLKGLSADEILKRFSPNERVKGLSTEQILQMLSPEEVEAYLKKLRKKRGSKK